MPELGNELSEPPMQSCELNKWWGTGVLTVSSSASEESWRASRATVRSAASRPVRRLCSVEPRCAGAPPGCAGGAQPSAAPCLAWQAAAPAAQPPASNQPPTAAASCPPDTAGKRHKGRADATQLRSPELWALWAAHFNPVRQTQVPARISLSF